jgi:hypothetical protein
MCRYRTGCRLGGAGGRVAGDRCPVRGGCPGGSAGPHQAAEKATSRARRKRALTAESSSRWAGAITRTSEDQYRLAEQSLRAERASLRTRVTRIEERLAVPVGGRSGKTRGYPTPAERHAKDLRRRALRARLTQADRRLAAGSVRVTRGGKALLRKRANLAATARQHGACAVVIEDLDFAQARAEGRERIGNRPSRGRRGRAFRRAVAGIPTGKFRDRLVQMTANAGLHVIVTDPAYTSRWGAQHWLAPLREHHPETTGHHAAALVTGRRGLGHRARRRATGNRTAPEDAMRPAQARTRKTPAARPAPRKPATPRGPRQPPGTKTRTPHRTMAGNQAAQHRPGPPANQDHPLLSRLGTVPAL